MIPAMAYGFLFGIPSDILSALPKEVLTPNFRLIARCSLSL